MPVRVTEVCDFCDSDEDIISYAVTDHEGKGWRNLLCAATHDKQMQRLRSKGTPVAQAVQSGRTSNLDRMVRGVPLATT